MSVIRPVPVPAGPFARIGVMTEKDASPVPLQRLQPVKRGQHRLAVVRVAWQAALAECLTEVAGVGGEHDFPPIEPQPKRLVARRVPVRRQAHHRAVAEHVVLAIDQPQFMAEVEVAPVEPALRGGIGVHTGLPLATLYQHSGIRDQRVAADMIEMKMRVDDEVDLARISVDRFEPCTDFFAGLKADTEKPGKPFTEPSSGVALAIGVQPGVKQCPSPGVLDKKDRDRHRDVALATLHQMGELAGYRTASESIEVDCHLPSDPLSS